MEIETFTGGIFDTNCYFLLKHGILVDAPQEAADWLARRGHKVRTLLITHGHIDHVWDAARIKQEHGCRVGYHADGVEMLTQPNFFKRFGFNWEIEPVSADFLISDAAPLVTDGLAFEVLHVPGHCPGSLAFHEREAKVVFSGDALFAGSIGRTDLPGGDHDLLLRVIREKLFALDDDVTVLSGHGPATKIGIEKRTNPFLQ